MSDQTTFWNHFEQKNFAQAEHAFESLSSDDKQAVFARLFQQSQTNQQPHSISVLFRKLNDGKLFEDFYQAWRPPKEKCNPQVEGDVLYENFFPMPIRVINAVNINDPSDIVSVGMHWMTDEQLTSALNNKQTQDDGAQRGDKISEVAEKTHTGIYKVIKDDNLGSPF